MTALTVPAQPGETASPLPWRRMAGVTWRQHRFALIGVAALLGALAVCLWITGSSLHSAPTPPRPPATRQAPRPAKTW